MLEFTLKSVLHLLLDEKKLLETVAFFMNMLF